MIKPLTCLLLLLATFPSAALLEDTPNTPTPGCSPELPPAEVIRTQIESLRNNTALNDGIERTFELASPKNRAQTGPLERFVSMVLAPPYDLLVNHASASFSRIEIADSQAVQRVTVTANSGSERSYLWVLSRQTVPGYLGCWMTDAVIPLNTFMERRLT